MTSSKTPTEKQLLTKLLGIMTNDREYAEYTNQISMIKARLKQLK